MCIVGAFGGVCSSRTTPFARARAQRIPSLSIDMSKRCHVGWGSSLRRRRLWILVVVTLVSVPDFGRDAVPIRHTTALRR